MVPIHLLYPPSGVNVGVHWSRLFLNTPTDGAAKTSAAGSFQVLTTL